MNEKFPKSHLKYHNGSRDFNKSLVNLILVRQTGVLKSCLNHLPELSPNFGTKHMITNKHFKERLYPICQTDKIFASTWINDEQVITGTKCGKLMVIDVNNNHTVQIPKIKKFGFGDHSEFPLSIHSICINPSQNLLATVAESSNDIAIYSLPTFDPVFIGESAHSDYIFDITWLDDEFLVSGSRDTSIALWKVDGNNKSFDEQKFPKYSSITPLSVKKCKNAEKVRAIVFNKNYQELVVVSLNAYLHLWDTHTFKQKYSQALPFCLENVCLSMQMDRKLYAIGSKSHVSLLDTSTLKVVCEIPSEQAGCSIRSTSFNDDILTIGTGMGTVMFYDIRAKKYMEQYHISNHKEDPFMKQDVAKLCSSRGYVKQSSMFWELYHSYQDYYPAIYTHCYDYSGTKLFTAGGPLPAFIEGSYISLWQ